MFHAIFCLELFPKLPVIEEVYPAELHPVVEAAVEVNPRKACAGPGCTIMGGKRKYRI
jgi:hypothetical protein